ncbi:MAG: MscL family protein [Lacisediminihabitans sp.]
MFKGFKEFILRGNVIDPAVAVVIAPRRTGTPQRSTSAPSLPPSSNSCWSRWSSTSRSSCRSTT